MRMRLNVLAEPARPLERWVGRQSSAHLKGSAIGEPLVPAARTKTNRGVGHSTVN